METLWQDLRYSLRALVRKPAFTLATVITLALGIGANTAIFSVINALLLRSLPYPDAGRLVMVTLNDRGGPIGNTSYADYTDWKERSRSFDQLSAIRSWGGTLTGQGEPEMIEGMRVSASYFRTLGISPALGRDFTAAEDRPDTRFVVILSHSLWQRRFNADPAVIGKPVVLTGNTFTVVGVMPRGFEDFLAANFYQRAEVWAPLGYSPADPWACRGCQHLKAVGRVRSDVSLDQARAEMNAISEALVREHPQSYPMPGITITRLQDDFVGALRPALFVLLGAVGFVLLIACANVANLLLARATERQREMAIRAALGASRGRIMRQLLTESVTLSMLGAGLGLLLSAWGTELLTALSPATMFKLQEVRMDGRVLGFTLAISILTGLLFGLAPALHAARPEVQLALSEGGRGSSGKGQRRLRGLLVVTEVALALVLLIGAGLLVRSFTRLLDVTPGFESGNLLTMMVPANGPRYEKDEQVRAFYQEAIKRIERLPGVEAAGIVSNLPLGGNMDKSGLHIEEKPLANPADAPSAERYSISPDYLRAMRIPVLRGRGFTDQDGANAPLVALINQTLARQVWPNEDPIGKRIRLGSIENPLRTIVGVVGDVNHYGLDTPPDLQAYVPHAQWTDSYMLFAVRTANDPTAIADAARREVWSVDKDIPVYQVATMERLVASSVAQRRFTLVLLGVFAGVALLVAAIGIYSVMSYSVTNRTNEIGIRMALGAGAGDVFRLVVGQGMKLAAAGVATGLIAAFALTRLMTGLLFGVSASDPLTFAGVGLLLALVAFVACWIPARRATKVDPMTALRCE